MKKNVVLTAIIISMLCGCGLKTTESASSSTAAADSTAAESATAEMMKKTCRKIDYYDYSAPAPASAKVDDSYFEDTFFGGDSRMGSIALYSDIPAKGAEVYYAESLRLYMIEETQIQTPNGTDTMLNLAMNTTRNNLYFLLGINEIRMDSFDDWASYYEEEIQKILAARPDVSIYLMMSYYPQGLSDISDDQLKVNVDTINTAMKNIAVKYHLYLLDIDASMKDENGKVRDDLVWDGLHFNEAGAQAYADYIATHVVRKDEYVKEVCE